MSVHSHAVAPESSGAFFLDMGTERCVFQAGGLRNALRASAAVHATDVMVNTAVLQTQKSRPSGRLFLVAKTFQFSRKAFKALVEIFLIFF